MGFGQGAMEGLGMIIPAPSLAAFWKGKRVLLTGHTGFKGSWMTLWLNRLGAQVTGVSLPPATSPSLFSLANIAEKCESHFCDIRDLSAFTELVKKARPQIAFHMAAQALVRPGYDDPVSTFSTNIMGTAHLLDALRNQADIRVAVMITTDKVYRNEEWVWPYRENDTLGGHDPYSASKAASEIVIGSYRDAFLSAQNVAIASARAGNVIGGGDWSDDRLIPDAIRAWQNDHPLLIRRPEASRPWQHVLEPLYGYLTLGRKLWEDPSLAGAFNFGPPTADSASVRDVIEMARSVYGTGEVNYSDGSEGPHEAGLLSLEISKARQLLGVTPKWTLQQTLNRTINWYREQHQGKPATALCLNDIAAYEDTL